MSLPHLAEFGWRATVLAVSPEHVEGLQDPLLLETVPSSTRVVRTPALSARRTRYFGVGNLALRAFPFLKREGDRLFSTEHFDLVFFSTTAFPVMALGRHWLKRRRVPYVLDFQDPWFSEYFSSNGETPPGGRFKYGMSQKLAQWLEPYALKKASHIISVSPGYREMLLKRYEWLSSESFTVLPFGAAEGDFDCARSSKVEQRFFDPSDGMTHWVYVGCAGTSMSFTARAFLCAVADARRADSARWKNVRIHFIGTDYAPAEQARKTIQPIAGELGLSEIVEEVTDRIPYLQALHCMLDADALIVLGSDDPTYTPSKIYPYILANKPLLVLAHKQSSAVDVLRATNAGTMVTFATGESISEVSQRIGSAWFASVPTDRPMTDWTAMARYSAREMTRKLSAVFDVAVPTQRVTTSANGRQRESSHL